MDEKIVGILKMLSPLYRVRSNILSLVGYCVHGTALPQKLSPIHRGERVTSTGYVRSHRLEVDGSR